MGIYVGLDCGGSTTRVVAVDDDRKVVFQGQSGAANLVNTPDEALQSHLARAARGCPTPTVVCGCFAGLIGPSQQDRGKALLRRTFRIDQVVAEPDYAATLAAAGPHASAVVIAGTGSLVCSRVDGALVRSGGRGYLLGDAGSAFQYGRDALNHFLDAPDAASPALRAVVEEYFGDASPPEMIAHVYRTGTPAALLARLAPALAKDLRAGETYAQESLARNAGALGRIVARHLTTYLPNDPNLVVVRSGGVWKLGMEFRRAFEDAVQSELSGRSVKFEPLAMAPVMGAVELALRAGNQG